MLVFLTGLAFSAGLIIAIGAQNAFLLRQGLKREHVLLVVLICSFADAMLIGLGAVGMGTLIASRPWLTRFAGWAGALFLAGYALLAFRSAFQTKRLTVDLKQPSLSRSRVVMTTLVGAATAQLPGNMIKDAAPEVGESIPNITYSSIGSTTARVGSGESLYHANAANPPSTATINATFLFITPSP